ncbi:MAG: hypothetical protein F6K47_17240 [Symploca sp. SIO2E6]|nr:hypothetical protein [Symploca sp. SIO2E6]
MKLPIQSEPVMRNVSTAAFVGEIEASGIGCTACCAAANLLPSPLNIAAKAACTHIGGCDC